MNVLIRFRTGHGIYAVPIAEAMEVRSASTLVALPSPAPGIAGVIDRSGTTVPVVSVLGGGSTHIVVVTDGADQVGILSDEVLGVARVPDAAVSAPPPGQDEPLVCSIVREDGGLTFVVDVAELVRHVRDHELEAVMGGPVETTNGSGGPS